MFEIPPNSLYAILFIIGLLVIGTGVRFWLYSKNPDKDDTELWQRIKSWWWMIGILFVALGLSKLAGIVLFGFISFLMLKEFLSIVPTRQNDRRAIFWAYLAIPIQYYWVHIGWYGMFTIFIPVYVFLFLPMRMIMIGETKGFIRPVSILHWATMLTVFSISHIAYLLTLSVQNEQSGAIGLILFLLFMTQFNDISQYVFGKIFGRHKIIPKGASINSIICQI